MIDRTVWKDVVKSACEGARHNGAVTLLQIDGETMGKQRH